MSYADHEVYELERLASERAAAARRTAAFVTLRANAPASMRKNREPLTRTDARHRRSAPRARTAAPP